MKKGNISIVLLVSLVVLLCGSAIISTGVNSKWKEVESYQRIADRYVSESGIDLAIGLFETYLTKQEFILTYTQNADGSYSVLDDFSPYLLDEIRQDFNVESVEIERISTESNDYLSGIGYLGFKKGSGVSLSINTFYQKENFKLSQMCIQPDFALGNGYESVVVRSKINPVYLTVTSTYKGGEVLCNVELSGVYVARDPFVPCDIGDMASVKAWIDTTEAEIKYITYQNYRHSG